MSKEKFICENCGKEFEIYSSQRKGEHKFCSMRCQHEWRTGKTNLTKKKGVFKKCPICGQEFYCYPYEVNSKKTCSMECNYKLQRLEGIHKGENCNFWRGGFENYRGKNWYEQRNKARIRDNNTCRICGKTRDKHDTNMIVHHIVPFRFFLNDYIKANDLDNLICLCHNCHAKQESHQWTKVPKKYQYLLKGIKPQDKPPAGKRYSDEEIKFIKENYNKMEYRELAEIMGRTLNSVSDKILELGLRKGRKTVFNSEEIEFIKIHYPYEGEKYFKIHLPHISYNTIKSYCNRNQIYKIKHNTERSL